MAAGARTERVGHEIQAAISEALTRDELKDPRIRAAGLITVTRVRVAADLGVAWVALVVHGADERHAAAALAGFGSAAGRLRGLVARRLGLKKAPELRFELDQALDHQLELERLLQGVAPPVAAPSVEPDDPDEPDQG